MLDAKIYSIFQSRIVSRSTLSGGSINDVFLLKLSCGAQVVLKCNTADKPAMFQMEYMGLQALREFSGSQGPRVPQPLEYFSDGNNQYFLLEYIETAPVTKHFWFDFGVSLAQLHISSSAGRDRFGFEGDNFIGSSPQKNTWKESWGDFFFKNRLGIQLEMAIKRGGLDGKTIRMVEDVMSRLPDILPEPTPSLVHGDLWSGNVMVGGGGRAVIFDPAVYYGHAEVDIAMSELFGRFDADFYRGYYEVIPQEPGYTERRRVYNLYHALNHFNLFGPSYIPLVRENSQ